MFELSNDINAISGLIVRQAMKVHSYLGPGLLEKAYEEALTYFLKKEGLSVERQVEIPILLPEVALDCGFRIDMIVNNQIVVEIKSVENFNRLYLSQLKTYLKFSEKNLGLILNFNVPSMKDGIHRVINTMNTLPYPAAPALKTEKR